MGAFKKGDGFTGKSNLTIENRKEIFSSLINSGYTMLCDWYDVYMFNGVLWAVCVESDVNNLLTLDEII